MMNIRWRVFLLLLAAVMLSVFALSAVYLWGGRVARQEAMENGRQMGEVLGDSMERVSLNLSQRRLEALAKKKAHALDRSLRTIKGDTEYIAFMMERSMARSEGGLVSPVKTMEAGAIAGGEAYLYLAPGIRSQEARERLSSELVRASGIVETLEKMADTYRGSQGSVMVASKNGYMLCADFLPEGQTYVDFTEEFVSSYVPQDRPWYQAALKAGKSTMTDIYTTPDGFTAINYAVPYSIGQEFAGVASIGISLQIVYKMLDEQGLGLGMGLDVPHIDFVLNHRGAVVLSSAKEGLWAVNEGQPDLRQSSEADLADKVQSMVEGHSGVVSLDLDGEAYYLAYEPLPSAGWSFGTLVKAEKFIAPAREARDSIQSYAEEIPASLGAFFGEKRQGIFYLMPVILLLLAVVSKKAADQFVQPILSLTAGVRDIAGGNLDKKLSIRTGDELEALSASVNHMTGELKAYMESLVKVTADKQRTAKELAWAQGIQESMLPKVFPKLAGGSGYEIFATMEAAKTVGGDFYDFYKLDKDHIVVTMADVSGKGIGAALFMVIAKTVLKNLIISSRQTSLGALISYANDQLKEENTARMFLTAFIGILNLKTGKFTFVNGGHNPPLIYRSRDNSFSYLEVIRNFVLAGRKGMKYQEQELTLYPGDGIFLYTDGVTEAMDETEELYGEDRLLRVLEQAADKASKPRELLAEVRADMAGFVGEAEQSDDITMLAFVYQRQENASGGENNGK